MRGIVLLLTFFFICSTTNCLALVDVPNPIKNTTAKLYLLKQLSKLTPKQIELTTGKKITLKQRIGLRLLKWQMVFVKDNAEAEEDPKAVKQAKLAMIFGASAWGVSLLGIVLPFVGILAVPSAIVAVVLGLISIKKVKNKTNSTLGILLGGIYLLVMLLAVLLVVAIFAQGFR
jgi:hypothetical protein